MKELWSKEGVLTMAGSGKEYVIDCVSGYMIPKASARYIGFSKKWGGPFWIHQDANILDLCGQPLKPSKPKETTQ